MTGTGLHIYDARCKGFAYAWLMPLPPNYF